MLRRAAESCWELPNANVSCQLIRSSQSCKGWSSRSIMLWTIHTSWMNLWLSRGKETYPVISCGRKGTFHNQKAAASKVLQVSLCYCYVAIATLLLFCIAFMYRNSLLHVWRYYLASPRWENDQETRMKHVCMIYIPCSSKDACRRLVSTIVSALMHSFLYLPFTSHEWAH